MDAYCPGLSLPGLSFGLHDSCIAASQLDCSPIMDEGPPSWPVDTILTGDRELKQTTSWKSKHLRIVDITGLKLVSTSAGHNDL